MKFRDNFVYRKESGLFLEINKRFGGECDLITQRRRPENDMN